MSQQSSNFNDLYLASVNSSIELMNACLSGVERLQNYQLEAVADFRSAQGDMSKQIGAARSLDELQSTQADLARKQMTTIMGYWSGLYATACRTQVDLLKESSAKFREMAANVSQKFEGVPVGSQPVVSALKLVFDAAQSTYAATVRATEEMVRLSAAQVDAANTNATVAARQVKAKRAA